MMIAQELLDEIRKNAPASDPEIASRKSEIQDCLFEFREGERFPMFYVRKDGWGKFFLNKYAIIPIEKYEDLVKQAANAVLQKI